jgi:archaellum component FlaC
MASEERFDRIEARFDRIEELFNRSEERFNRIDERLDRNEARFDRIDANIERLSDTLKALSEFVLDFRQETAQHFEVIDNRLDILTATVVNIEARFPTLIKGVLDFGKLATQITNEQFRNRHTSAELTLRVDRLEEKVSKLINPAA